MPRAFLITHRRYNSVDDGEQRESSPEHKVSLPEAPTSPNAVQPVFYRNRSYEDDHITDGNSSSTSTDCPDDLYNLTKLAEVSLAAAAGQLYHHRHLKAVPVISQLPASEDTDTDKYPISYAHKLFDRGVRGQRQRSQSNEPRSNGVSARTTSVYGSTGSASPELEVTHECPDCGKRYSTSSNLARHRQTHRSLADKKARRCPHCDKVYVSMPAYSMHVRTHNQGCKCHFCGKCFSRPWLLQGHIRTHTGEKPFKCTVCQKAFADKSNLRAHIQTHSNTKPHVCGRCGKAFALKSYLYKHEESSCMRGQRTSDQSPQPIAAPTPVIVHPDRPYRSTVISPNPERILYSSVEHPSAILTASRYCIPEDQPVDFSASRDVFSASSERKTGYAIGLAIAV